MKDLIIKDALSRHGVEDDPLVNEIFLELFIIEDMYDRITAQERAKIQDLIENLQHIEEQTSSIMEMPRFDFPYGGAIDDAIVATRQFREYLTAELKTELPERKRPTTTHGRESMRVYDALKKSGIDDDWLCVKIIADILISTGKSQKSADKLHKSLWDRIQRVVR